MRKTLRGSSLENELPDDVETLTRNSGISFNIQPCRVHVSTSIFTEKVGPTVRELAKAHLESSPGPRGHVITGVISRWSRRILSRPTRET